MTQTGTTEAQFELDYATSIRLSDALTAGLKGLGWKKRQNVVTDGSRNVTRLFMRGGKVGAMLFTGPADARTRHDVLIESDADVAAFLELVR